jgi:GrpB-like predicted nucleotidyltransferase (UPF0157 family)
MIPFEPYNPDWREQFRQLKKKLETHLHDYAVDIQHVGSTSIPGLPAKPILDIDILLADQSQLSGVSSILENAGYHNRGDQGIPGRFAFRQQSIYTPNGTERTKWMEHHLYVCFTDSLALKNHLLFRDALLADKALCMQYAALKERLTGRNGISREQYTREKTEFILEVLRKQGMTTVELSAIRAANS